MSSLSSSTHSIDTHEFFSLTNQLTQLTSAWNAIAASKRECPMIMNMDCSMQLKGIFLSRIVNLLILPTELLDAIAHILMGALTLLVLAPGEALYNWNRAENEQSNRFTVCGGLTNFGYAAKHLLEAIPRAVLGILDPQGAFHKFETETQRHARARLSTQV